MYTTINELNCRINKSPHHQACLLVELSRSPSEEMMLLTTWLNSWKSISQPANFAHLLILPFSVFPLYAHTRLVKGHFLMLRQQSWTHSLMKSGHLTPSHASNHHLILIFFSSPTDCVCVGWGGEEGRGRESEGERERVRERASGLSQSVTVFFFLHLFYFM